MKTIFIPAKIKSKVNIKKIQSLKLPKSIAIAYSIQYKDVAEKIKKVLVKNHTVKLLQVLGCSKPKFSKDIQAILLISSGKFHAISLAIESKLPIYILEHNKLRKISKEDIESFKKKQKVSYMKFLNANKIGILISTKSGQQNLKKAIAFKKKLKEKKSYLFISNNIDIREFENFGLNSWVNTACPRMDMNDSSIINIDRIN